LCEDSLKYVRHLFDLTHHERKDEISCGSSDKENERSPHPSGKNKKPRKSENGEEVCFPFSVFYNYLGLIINLFKFVILTAGGRD
jgi:hypothetical protein